MRRLEQLINFLLSFLVDLYYYIIANLRARVQNPKYYYASKKYPDFMKNGSASSFIQNFAKEICVGKGIDLGAGGFPLPGARAVDLVLGEGAENIKESSSSLDYVFSSHMMEHVENLEVVMREISRVIKVGGKLFLYLPHPLCEMWHPTVFKYHKRALDPAFMKTLVEAEKFHIVDMSTSPDTYFSYYIVAEKTI